MILKKMNNNLNGFAPEKRYSYSIMDEIKVSMISGDKKVLQKRKFELISKLVSDLFKYKGRRGCYETISNLIISSLISFDEDSPIDIFSDEDDSEGKMDESCKKILERELFEFSNDLPN